MKKCKIDWIGWILAIVIVGTVLGGLVYWDYFVWSSAHPDAPFWTYLFRE